MHRPLVASTARISRCYRSHSWELCPTNPRQPSGEQPARRAETYVYDGIRDIQLRLILRIQALHDVLLRREPRVCVLARNREAVPALRERHLDRAPLVHGDGVLLDPFHRLAARAHAAALARPIFSRFEREHGRARIHGLAAELAQLDGRVDDLVALEVPREDVAAQGSGRRVCAEGGGLQGVVLEAGHGAGHLLGQLVRVQLFVLEVVSIL